VERDAERGVVPECGDAARVDDRPGQGGCCAEINSRDVGSDAVDGEGDGSGWGERVGDTEQRQTFGERIEDGGDGAEKDADRGDPEIVHTAKSEDPKGVLQEDAEVRDDDKQACADECGEDGVEREVPDFVGVKVETAGEVDGSSQPNDEGERCERSVGGYSDVSELEEARMHFGGSGPGGVAAGVSANFDYAAEKKGDGEAEAESFDEVHGVVLKRDEKTEAKAHSQRGEAGREEPPFLEGFFHEADVRYEVKTDPLGRAVTRR